ncbi:MAG: ACT domain-containing protein [Phycisphaerales bacterium]|nr:ACT domain-containing protein [Phycisphaerales bacterium]
MSYSIKQIEVWAGDILNRPGMLARVVEALTTAGANLEFMVARKVNENTSRVFLSPIKGKKVLQAAMDVGLARTANMHTVRIEGPDRPGLGAAITRAVAGAGVNLRGATAAVIGNRAVINLGVGSPDDAKNAVKAAKIAVKPSRNSSSSSKPKTKPKARKAARGR